MTTSHSTPRRRFTIAREVLLWLAAAFGVLCALVAASALAFGIRPLIFHSGSMTPTIPTGGLALSQTIDSSAAQVGDIVSFEDPNGVRVTHRVVQKDVAADGGTVFHTKGDANESEDPYTTEQATVDRVFWSTPELGYVVDEAFKPQYTFATGAVIGMIALVGFRRRDAVEPLESAASNPTPTEPPRDPSDDDADSVFDESAFADTAMEADTDTAHRGTSVRRRNTAVVTSTVAGIIAIVGIASAIAAPTGTLASFVNTGISSASFTTATSFGTGTPPGAANQNSITCSGANGSGYVDLTVTWTPGTGTATSYTVALTGQTTASYTYSTTTNTATAVIRLPRQAVDQFGNPTGPTAAYYQKYTVKITPFNGSTAGGATYRTYQYEFYNVSNCYYADQV